MGNFEKVYDQVIDELTIQNMAALQGSDFVLNVPCVMGPVGVGKTSLAKTAALHFALPLEHLNFGDNSDPTDSSGFPHPGRISTMMGAGDQETAYAEWVLNKSAAAACSMPVLLFLDDVDKAPGHVQNALLSLTGERRFRDKKLHPGTLMMLAGNRLGDDVYANTLSESIRTRITIIELDVGYNDFAEWAEKSGRIHPLLVGYLGYKRDHLHKMVERSNRFPTPRGYEEASMHMFHFPEQKWKEILSRKIGPEVATDFNAWYTIIRKINVEEILTNGKFSSNDETPGRAQYAAIYAVVAHLNAHGVKPNTMPGLETFIHSLENEMKVAMMVQLKMKQRTALATHYPAASTALTAVVLKKKEKAK